MRTALIIVAVLIVMYAAILGLLWRVQERIVFQPPVDPESSDAGTSTIAYTSSDGIDLFAHVVEAGNSGAPVVLAFHGNAMISRWMIPWARELSRRLGVTVVLPEYRGYDGLAGVPTYPGAALDAVAALRATERRFQIRAEQMTYYGHSLGTAVAAELAAVHPPAALVLESPFTSAREMASRLPFFGLGFFWKLISRVHYQTATRVRQLEVPVHVAHGELDVIIPVRMGRSVYDAALKKGALLLVGEAGHNDVPAAGGASYWRWIGEALREGPH